MGIKTKKDIFVLIACVIFALMNIAAIEHRGRERARRIVCLANIKQLTAACNVFADENDGMMPLPRTAGYWLQDVDVGTVNSLLETGITRKLLYCPSNTSHQKYNDLFWLYSNASWDGERFTRESGFIISGYCAILQTITGTRPAIRAYQKDTEKKIWIRTNRESSPATRELFIDSIMGIQQSNTKYGYNFGQISGGIYAQGAVYDRTNHLITNEEPPGGNIGFLDGHGEWRIFDPDIENGVAVPRYQNIPGFFW